MRLRARTMLATIVATGCVVLALSGAALAGFFDYTLSSAPNDTFQTRGVGHDYTYLHSSINSSSTTCVARGGGSSFCASGTASHSYVDTCGSCLSYYKQKTGGTFDISAHDEW
ncbi:hypothetical protein DSM104299_03805 [Baekduia alba]|nr:hypothetical protein DSM104299_03805 [Baekduia alba]